MAHNSGTHGNDREIGGSGADYLSGGKGNDTLVGGAGTDDLSGGPGRDLITGGSGADDFYIYSIPDASAPGPRAQDTIKDFSQSDHDRLVVTGPLGTIIDNRFIGTSVFGGVAGEVGYRIAGGNTFVRGDEDGDGVADFRVKLKGVHHLTAGDFKFD